VAGKVPVLEKAVQHARVAQQRPRRRRQRLAHAERRPRPVVHQQNAAAPARQRQGRRRSRRAAPGHQGVEAAVRHCDPVPCPVTSAWMKSARLRKPARGEPPVGSGAGAASAAPISFSFGACGACGGTMAFSTIIVPG
jgi:hypothetical protein